MNPIVAAQLESPSCPDYERLPQFIRDYMSPKEYLWLSDREKAELVQQDTEPEA